MKNPELNTVASAQVEGHWAVYQQRMLKSIENFNEQNLDTTYNEVLSIYPIDMVTEQVIIPVLAVLGERWQDRDAGKICVLTPVFAVTKTYLSEVVPLISSGRS